MTFSIVARCEKTDMFGVAVSSSSPAVAARCAFASAGIGAVTSQNITDPALGDECLSLLKSGSSAREAIEKIANSTRHIEYRQLTAVDAQGSSWCFSGSETLGVNASCHALNVACAGNLLANTNIPEAMVAAFEKSDGHLADRLLLSMNAGVAAGGEAGPVHSAGLKIVDQVAWPVADLRVDWDEEGDPIGKLVKLWAVYEPQLEAYVTRARDPSEAPSYGVPGDE